MKMLRHLTSAPIAFALALFLVGAPGAPVAELLPTSGDVWPEDQDREQGPQDGGDTGGGGEPEEVIVIGVRPNLGHLPATTSTGQTVRLLDGSDYNYMTCESNTSWEVCRYVDGKFCDGYGYVNQLCVDNNGDGVPDARGNSMWPCTVWASASAARHTIRWKRHVPAISFRCFRA